MLSSKIPALREKIFARLSNKDLAELPALELDLLMQHIRELYEELDALKKERSAHKPQMQERVIAKPEEKPAETEKQTEVEISRPTAQKQPAAEHVTAKTISAPIIEKEKKLIEKEKKLNAATLNEKVDFGTSLNEKLKSNSLTEVHRKLSSRPLKDLIDLNKKHVMVNELFAGNSKNYVEAIEEIDAFVDYETAQTYIRSRLIAVHNWDESNQAVRMFVKLVKQKFAIE